MDETEGKTKEILKQMSAEQLAELKIESEEILLRANDLIEECDEVINS